MLKFKIYLQDILGMTKRIVDYSNKVGMDFRNLVYYDSTLMRLQVIGELVKKLPKEWLKKYPEVEWSGFIKFREVVSHEYFRINHKILNDTIQNELPKLKFATEQMPNELK